MAFDIQSFRKTLLYQATPSAVQLQANFRQIAAQDKQAEKKSVFYWIVTVIAGLLTFGSLFLLSSVPGIAFVPIVLFGVTVVIGIIASRWSRLNIQNLRYELPVNLVDMLSRDMKKDAPLDVRVDFSKPTDSRKQVSKGPWAGRAKWTEAVFEDHWMRLSGRFLDDTLFALMLNEHTVVRSGWKRGRSGKMKRKTKTKPKGFEAEVVLQFSRKKYGAIALLENDLSQAMQLPNGVTLKKIKANDHQLVIKAKVPPGFSQEGFYQLFTQMLLSAYQGLNLSKELSKAS